MDRFLPYKDDLGELIQSKAEQLLALMKTINVDKLGLTEHGYQYFIGSHYKRLFFSIQTSAHLLYNSISLCKKEVKDVVIMDYGAGIGSLYILAKMIGCKQVIYNDILEDWKRNALLIAEAIHKDVDEYIVGNIEETLIVLEKKNIVCDIITSRNVIEHIYKLDDYYKTINSYQPKAIIYSSTTANFNNPAMNLQHVFLHRRHEKVFLQQRIDFIKNQYSQFSEKVIRKLAINTRGYEKNELLGVLNKYCLNGEFPKKNYSYTNTCDMNYGVWAENLLKFEIHKKMIESNGRVCRINPGFWDTHYQKPWKNKMGSIFNSLIALNTFLGFLLAPFIYVIALPQNEKIG